MINQESKDGYVQSGFHDISFSNNTNSETNEYRKRALKYSKFSSNQFSMTSLTKQWSIKEKKYFVWKYECDLIESDQYEEILVFIQFLFFN